MCVQQKVNQFHTIRKKVQSLPRITEFCALFHKKPPPRWYKIKRNADLFCTFSIWDPNPFTTNLISSLCPLSPLLSNLELHLGGALPGSRGGRGGPAGLELGLVGVSRLRGRRGRRVPSLASLLEVALVPCGLSEHLHPALLVLLQASPEVCTLPVSLHLPRGASWREGYKAYRR